MINCSACQFFTFSKDIFNNDDKKGLIIQKTIVESKFIDVVCFLDEQLQDSSFTTLLDAKHPIYTNQYMSQPIIDSQGELIATIQVESKFRSMAKSHPKSNEEEGHDDMHSSKKFQDRDKKQFIGFSRMDE